MSPAPSGTKPGATCGSLIEIQSAAFGPEVRIERALQASARPAARQRRVDWRGDHAGNPAAGAVRGFALSGAGSRAGCGCGGLRYSSAVLSRPRNWLREQPQITRRSRYSTMTSPSPIQTDEPTQTPAKPRMSTRNRLLFFVTGWLIAFMPFLFWWNTWFGRHSFGQATRRVSAGRQEAASHPARAGADRRADDATAMRASRAGIRRWCASLPIPSRKSATPTPG